MTRTAYNFESLNRHGISVYESDEVIAHGIWFEIEPSERGNNRLMFVGFTAEGRLLEVGIEYFDDEDLEHIFHANDATESYRKLFSDRINQ